jgi:hypothetical protein
MSARPVLSAVSKKSLGKCFRTRKRRVGPDFIALGLLMLGSSLLRVWGAGFASKVGPLGQLLHATKHPHLAYRKIVNTPRRQKVLRKGVSERR